MSLSFGADGLFAFRVTPRGPLARDVLGVQQSRALECVEERGLRGAVALASGTLALMSGRFQRDFQHATIPSCEWGTGWAASLPARQRCVVAPGLGAPRINLTGRWVRRSEGEKATPPSPPEG